MLRLGPTATLLGRNYALDPCSGHLEAVEIRDLVAGTAYTGLPVQLAGRAGRTS
jgi:hypothetical protein